MKFKISSKIISAFIIISIITLSYNQLISWAANKSELNSELTTKNQEIQNTKNEISEIKTEMSAAMKEVQDLVAQISEYEQEIASLDAKIDETNTHIKEAEAKIEKLQKELDEKQKLLDQRLVALYESGSTTYIDVLLSSKGLTDFISNYYLIEELAEYDTDLINSIYDKKEEIEKTKTDLEESKKQIETDKELQVAKQNALLVVKEEKDAKVANLSSEEKELESSLSEMEKDKQSIYNQIRTIEAQEAAKQRSSSSASFGGTPTYVSTSPSAAGYVFPVAGLSIANMTNTSFPSYRGHTGVDVNIGVVGKSVVAVKSGTVLISTALRNSSGGYRSYGEYIVIDHHDGTKTLYAHMLSGSRTVSAGETVSQGQVIGTVGSTGNSTGPHLHFEVIIGGTPVNPIPYIS